METFITEYAKQLANAVREYPTEYLYGLDEVPSVVSKIKAAIQRGTYNKDGQAFKWTCKALKIKHTYADIRHFIDNHV